MNCITIWITWKGLDSILTGYVNLSQAYLPKLFFQSEHDYHALDLWNSYFQSNPNLAEESQSHKQPPVTFRLEVKNWIYKLA